MRRGTETRVWLEDSQIHFRSVRGRLQGRSAEERCPEQMRKVGMYTRWQVCVRAAAGLHGRQAEGASRSRIQNSRGWIPQSRWHQHQCRRHPLEPWGWWPRPSTVPTRGSISSMSWITCPLLRIAVAPASCRHRKMPARCRRYGACNYILQSSVVGLLRLAKNRMTRRRHGSITLAFAP